EVAHQVGLSDTRLAQRVVLVVPAHAGEGDAVIYLGDLAERPGRVLGHEQQPVGVLEGDDRTASSDSLAGGLRLVPNQLLGGGVPCVDDVVASSYCMAGELRLGPSLLFEGEVERHAHRLFSSARSASGST